MMQPISSTLKYSEPLKIAPQQVKKNTSRIRKPWYDVNLKHQRHIVKNGESKWVKYREQLHWKAYKRERNRFITMKNMKKGIIYITGQVTPQEIARNYTNSSPN